MDRPTVIIVIFRESVLTTKKINVSHNLIKLIMCVDWHKRCLYESTVLLRDMARRSKVSRNKLGLKKCYLLFLSPHGTVRVFEVI